LCADSKKSSTCDDDAWLRAGLPYSSTAFGCSSSASRLKLRQYQSSFGFRENVSVTGLRSTGACPGLLNASNFSASYARDTTIRGSPFDLSFSPSKVYLDGNLVLSGAITSSTSTFYSSGFSGK
jgi:hypothetical protein